MQKSERKIRTEYPERDRSFHLSERVFRNFPFNMAVDGYKRAWELVKTRVHWLKPEKIINGTLYGTIHLEKEDNLFRQPIETGIFSIGSTKKLCYIYFLMSKITGVSV